MTAFVGARTTDTMTAAVQTASGRAFGLGDELVRHDGTKWVYVQAAAAIAQYDVAYFTSAYAATSLSTSNDARGNLCGVAPVAFAINEFGWLQVRGPAANINVLASAAANVRLNTTATGGSLDDDGTATTMQVQGLYLTTARGGTNGPAPGILNNPYIDATL